MDYEGVIIAESLHDADVLSQLDIMDTVVEPITPEHKTPWLSQWTLHTVRVPEAKAREIAETLSHSINAGHATSWYADFQNDTHHFVVFRDRVFHIDLAAESNTTKPWPTASHAGCRTIKQTSCI
jgi:hypothetical protein